MLINVRLLASILFLFIATNLYGQTFTQTYIDRCTGNVQVVTANFVNGNATVAFYNRVRTFTYQEYVNGQLQQWLSETYAWWNALSPCSTATAQAQTAQQTAQTATTAASTASSAASTASTAATSSSAQTNSTNETNNTSTNNNQETSNSGGGEKTEETKTEETKTEESSEESKSEESSDEGDGEEGDGEEGGDEESSDDDNGDGEESEEEDVKQKKKKTLSPIQLRADMMVNQSLLNTFDPVMSFGATQSSIYGDKSYGLTGMLWGNLKQMSLGATYTKVTMEKLNISVLNHDTHKHYSKTNKVTVMDPQTPPTPKISFITSSSLSYMNNYGNGVMVLSYMKLKPMGVYGTVGAGVMFSNSFGENGSTSAGYNVLYTNSVQISPRIIYSPAIIWTQTPFSGVVTLNSFENDLDEQPIGGMGILSNSFTVFLTKRFSFNMGWTLIKSTDPLFPLLNSFMIGAKLPF